MKDAIHWAGSTKNICGYKYNLLSLNYFSISTSIFYFNSFLNFFIFLSICLMFFLTAMPIFFWRSSFIFSVVPGHIALMKLLVISAVVSMTITPKALAPKDCFCFHRSSLPHWLSLSFQTFLSVIPSSFCILLLPLQKSLLLWVLSFFLLLNWVSMCVSYIVCATRIISVQNPPSSLSLATVCECPVCALS